MEHSIPLGGPARFVSFRPAQAIARGSFRAHEKFVHMQKNLLACFGNRCDVASEAQELSGALTEKGCKKNENESYRYRKANRSNVGKHLRALSQGEAQL